MSEEVNIRSIVGAGRGGAADGGLLEVRLGQTGEVVTNSMHGRLYEAVLRGNVYSAMTAVTGVAPGTSVSTTSAFTLFNPITSGKVLSVLKASMGYVSGTLGAGVVTYNANTVAVNTQPSGTAIVPVNCLIGGSAGVAKPMTTVTIVAPSVMRPFCSIGASLATTACQPWQVIDECDGEFVILPGCALSLHATAAAGTTPLVVFGMVWEELTDF